MLPAQRAGFPTPPARRPVGGDTTRGRRPELRWRHAGAPGAANERFAGRAGFLGAFEPERALEEGRRFDAVLVVEVVEHLYDDVLDATLDRVRELLAPGGVAIFTTPNEEDLAKGRRYCPACDRVFHEWQHVRSWSAESLAGRLSARGFRVLDTFTTDFGAAFLRGNKKKWKAIRKRVRRRLRPGAKQPHLAVVARVAEG